MPTPDPLCRSLSLSSRNALALGLKTERQLALDAFDCAIHESLHRVGRPLFDHKLPPQEHLVPDGVKEVRGGKPGRRTQVAIRAPSAACPQPAFNLT